MWSKARLAVAIGALGFAVRGGPALYRIDGYVDRAPEGVAVAETVRLAAHGRERAFLIVSYRRLGDGDPWLLVRDLGIFRPDFVLRGAAPDIARILAAPPGSRVRGTFRHLRGPQTWLIDPHGLAIE